MGRQSCQKNIPTDEDKLVNQSHAKKADCIDHLKELDIKAEEDETGISIKFK